MNARHGAISPQVSVCLPVWNGEEHLTEAIESVLNQTFENFELIIGNDCSIDSSAQIIAGFARQDARINVLPLTERLGLFGNYNRCMAAANAEILKLFAQDDLLAPNALAEIMKAFSANDEIALVSVERKLIDAQGEPFLDAVNVSPMEFFPDSDKRPVEGKLVANRLLANAQNFIGEPSAVALRRNFIGDGFDPTFHHLGDLDFWLRVIMQSSMIHIPEELCSFRRHKTAATTRNQENLLFASDMIRLLNKFAPVLESLEMNATDQLNIYVRNLSAHICALNSADLLSHQTLRSKESVCKSLHLSEVNYAEKDAFADDRDKILDELLLFRELAYHALIAMGNTAKAASPANLQEYVILARELEISILEKELSNYMNSVSWKTTKVLRDLNCKLFGSEIVSIAQINDYYQSETLTDTQNRQQAYLDYLNSLRRNIVESRSWRISRPLRILSNRIKIIR